MKVSFSRSADTDLDQIYLYVAQERPRAAADLLGRLLDAAAGLADFPLTGRPAGRLGERELTTVYPYIIIYVVRAGSVEITRIFHGAQDRY